MLPRDALAREVGTRFRIRSGPFAGVELLLSALEERTAAKDYDAFSLMFDGPAQPRLPQATYELEHPALGAHAVFIVPVADLAPGIRYEAAFNRRRA
jgi:Domain of unknown function (DUF6916)